MSHKPGAVDFGPLFDQAPRGEVNDRLLWAARLGAAYLGKAVAEGLMGDCAIPPSKALERIESIIEEARG
jgi:hypothetical protein